MKNSHRLRHRIATLGLAVLLALSMTPTSGIAYALGVGKSNTPTATETASDPATGSDSSSQGTGGQVSDGQTPGTVTDEKDSAFNAANPAEKDTTLGNGAEVAVPSGNAVTMLRAPQAPAALTELWVDGSNGSDTNDGSAAAPLATLAKALELQVADPSITRSTSRATSPFPRRSIFPPV